MDQTITIKGGVTLPKLRVTCKDPATGKPLDLSGATVKFLAKIGGALKTWDMAPVAPFSDGVAEYQFGTGEIPVGPATGEGEVEITSGARLDVSINAIAIEVLKRVQAA